MGARLAVTGTSSIIGLSPLRAPVPWELGKGLTNRPGYKIRKKGGGGRHQEKKNVSPYQGQRSIEKVGRHCGRKRSTVTRQLLVAGMGGEKDEGKKSYGTKDRTLKNLRRREKEEEHAAHGPLLLGDAEQGREGLTLAVVLLTERDKGRRKSRMRSVRIGRLSALIAGKKKRERNIPWTGNWKNRGEQEKKRRQATWPTGEATLMSRRKTETPINEKKTGRWVSVNSHHRFKKKSVSNTEKTIRLPQNDNATGEKKKAVKGRPELLRRGGTPAQK